MKITLNKTDKIDALRTYFSLLQFALAKNKQLSNLEIELLILFLSLPERFKYHRFSTLAKNKVIETAKEDMDWKLSRINVNNKIYSMIEKGVLIRDEDGVIYINKQVQKGIDLLLRAIEGKGDMEITFIVQIPNKVNSTNE
jgi:hypothetical protein